MKPDPARDRAARKAYEADCARRPTYHDGTPRKTWAQLDSLAKRSWHPDATG